MALIDLAAGGFSVIPEGTHVLKITKVDYNEAFGKITITMETRDAKKHLEKFTLINGAGETNQGALRAFSYFAKVAMKSGFSPSCLLPYEPPIQLSDLTFTYYSERKVTCQSIY